MSGAVNFFMVIFSWWSHLLFIDEASFVDKWISCQFFSATNTHLVHLVPMLQLKIDFTAKKP